MKRDIVQLLVSVILSFALGVATHALYFQQPKPKELPKPEAHVALLLPKGSVGYSFENGSDFPCYLNVGLEDSEFTATFRLQPGEKIILGPEASEVDVDPNAEVPPQRSSKPPL